MNTRRRTIINSNESLDYIKDGLVFHLDGADATTALWTDRIGGKEFAMTGVTIDSAKGGVVFYGSSSRGRNTNNIYYSKDTCTIEVVVNNTSTASNPEFVAFSNTQGGICAYLTLGCGYNALNKASNVTKFLIDSITGL